MLLAGSRLFIARCWPHPPSIKCSRRRLIQAIGGSAGMCGQRHGARCFNREKSASVILLTMACRARDCPGARRFLKTIFKLAHGFCCWPPWARVSQRGRIRSRPPARGTDPQTFSDAAASPIPSPRYTFTLVSPTAFSLSSAATPMMRMC